MKRRHAREEYTSNERIRVTMGGVSGLGTVLRRRESGWK
jgi:hypothetical protein